MELLSLTFGHYNSVITASLIALYKAISHPNLYWVYSWFSEPTQDFKSNPISFTLLDQPIFPAGASFDNGLLSDMLVPSSTVTTIATIYYLHNSVVT